MSWPTNTPNRWRYLIPWPEICFHFNRTDPEGLTDACLVLSSSWFVEPRHRRILILCCKIYLRQVVLEEFLIDTRGKYTFYTAIRRRNLNFFFGILGSALTSQYPLAITQYDSERVFVENCFFQNGDCICSPTCEKEF